MTKKLIATFIVSLTIILMVGCGILQVSYIKDKTRKNNSNLFNLTIGMTKSEVIGVMGQPSKTEAYEIQGENLEFWFYPTGYRDTIVTIIYYDYSIEYTPLAFEKGILKGWGRNYYDQALRIKQEIKIEQK